MQSKVTSVLVGRERKSNLTISIIANSGILASDNKPWMLRGAKTIKALVMVLGVV